MNGLQSVSVSLGKRIRYLSICPPGTCGRILSRRLTHTGQSPPDPAPADLPDPIINIQPNYPRSTLDAQAIRSLSNETKDAVNRLRSVLDQVVREVEKPVSPTPKEPLDSTLTGLDIIPMPNPDSPIGSLLRAIDEGDGPTIWNKFKELDHQFLLRTVKGHEFSAVLLSLQPVNFLRLKHRHRLDKNGKPYIISEKQAFNELKVKLLYVMTAMRKVGYRLSARECGHLIDCARAGKDPQMAIELWNLLCGFSVTQDTWSYNSFMAAVSGGGPSVEREFRVYEEILAHREKRAKGSDDMRKKAMKIYNKMTAKGILPNSMTFDILMLSLARMGDIAGVRRILKQVWDVDVNTLPDEAMVKDKQNITPADSPLYPTAHTLLAVATAFCQNGQVDTAIRTVDHISRRYDVPISVPTWVALMNWTYVYTRQRKENPLPGSAMESLWNVMTGEPYNVAPTIDMFDYIVRSYLWRRMPGMAEHMMELALVTVSRRILSKAHGIEECITYGRTARTIQDPEKGSDAATTKRTHTSAAIAKFSQDVAKLIRDEYRLWSIIRRWTELLVIGKDLEVTTFGPQQVPRIVDKWGLFLGKDIMYVLRTGYVELDLGKEGEDWRPITNRKRRWMWMTLGTGSKEEDDFF